MWYSADVCIYSRCSSSKFSHTGVKTWCKNVAWRARYVSFYWLYDAFDYVHFSVLITNAPIVRGFEIYIGKVFYLNKCIHWSVVYKIGQNVCFFGCWWIIFLCFDISLSFLLHQILTIRLILMYIYISSSISKKNLIKIEHGLLQFSSQNDTEHDFAW